MMDGIGVDCELHSVGTQQLVSVTFGVSDYTFFKHLFHYWFGLFYTVMLLMLWLYFCQ